MATLELTPAEKKTLATWRKRHYAPDSRYPSRKDCHGKCRFKPGSAGDLYYFHVCPTGIGMFVAVVCPCGAPKCDITGDNV
jgi:hypothetical protein